MLAIFRSNGVTVEPPRRLSEICIRHTSILLDSQSREVFSQLRRSFSNKLMLDDQNLTPRFRRGLQRERDYFEGGGKKPKSITRAALREHQESSKRFGSALRKQEFPRLTIRLVNPDVGYGLFAAETIRKATLVGEYSGVVREYSPNHQDKPTDSCHFFYHPNERVEYAESAYIDPVYQGGFLQFVNHGSVGNIDFLHIFQTRSWRVIAVSLRTISKGQQILFEYPEDFWEGSGIDPVELA